MFRERGRKRESERDIKVRGNQWQSLAHLLPGNITVLNPVINELERNKRKAGYCRPAE